MSLKIVCPSCQHTMALKSFKAGKFKPTCSKCGTIFSLHISTDTPPIVVAKKIESPAVPSLSNTKLQDSIQPPDVAQTIFQANQPTLGDSVNGKDHREFENTLPAEPKLPSNPPGSLAPTLADINPFSKTIETKLPTTLPIKSTEQTAPPEIAPSIPSRKNLPSHGTAISEPRTTSSTPQRLGGYRILKVLGEGGMGAVYLAKQLSLDRSVALKTIQTQWASSPRVVARFIREAYAAAQLTHHNVVQIYDLGEDSGTNFFSMELVGGGSLEDLLKQKGVLPPTTAATLILQAARGLKFAHDHGMVHRDIKPANLMLTNDGMLKVADLGLVKTPSMDDSQESFVAEDANLMLASARSNVTFQGSTMGTPSYMSPEQADDASSVDHRADIYSLGCTFYALLTGRPPFVSNTVIELLSKHKMEKIPRPESIIHSLPGVLGDIIDKMTAKRPEDRYQDMQLVIQDIESFLGLGNPLDPKSSLPYNNNLSRLSNEDHQTDSHSEVTSIPVSQALDAPSSERTALSSNADSTAIYDEQTIPHTERRKALPANDRELEILQKSARDFASSPLRLLQQHGPILLISLCVLLGLLYLSQSLSTSLFFLLIGVFTPSFTLVTSYFHGNSLIVQRLVHTIKLSSITDWVYFILGALLLLFALYVSGIWLTILLAFILSALLGIGYYYLIDETLRKLRKSSLQLAESAVKHMRLRGLCEEDIYENLRQISSPCQTRWLESIFGYRPTLKPSTANTKASGIFARSNRSQLFDMSLVLRNQILNRMDERIAELRDRKDRTILTKIEKASLVASGASTADANRRAAEAADALVEVAQETKRTMAEINLGNLSDKDAADKRIRIKRMLSEARQCKTPKTSLAKRSLNLLLSQSLGGKMRFTLGAFLLAGFALWAEQNQIFSNETIAHATKIGQETTNETSSAIDRAAAAMNGTQELASKIFRTDTKQLSIPIVGSLFQNFAPAFAGLVLVISSLMTGWRISLIMLPAALVMLVGPSLGIPSLGELISAQTLSITLGILIALTGGWLIRS